MIPNFRYSIYLLLIVCITELYSQLFDRKFCASFSFNYTTGMDFYPDPNSSDVEESKNYHYISKLFGYSGNIRYQIYDKSFFISIGVEKIKKNFDVIQAALVNNSLSVIKVVDNIEINPFEVNLIYLMPFSTEMFDFYFGCGFGIYNGSYYRSIGTEKSILLNFRQDVTMIVLMGMEYNPLNFLSVRGEMKFRDPDLLFYNTFESTNFNVGQNNIKLFQKDFSTRIKLNGINFDLGLVIKL